MDVVFKAQPILLYICIAIFVVTLLSVLLKKGQVRQRIAALAIVVVACGAILFFFYRDRHFIVDDQGISTDANGKASIPWESIQKASRVENLSATPYAPRTKTFGTAIGSYRVGWFILANGRKAYVVMESGDRALVFDAGDVTYIFGMKDLDTLTTAVAAHVTVTKEMGEKQ